MKTFVKALIFIILFLNTKNSWASGPTIYLDFDGETVNSYAWNGGTSFVCAASGLTSVQELGIFGRVKEDFSAFDVLVTTSLTDYLAAPALQRMRVIVTPTSSWYASGVGGIAYVGSFTWGNDIPAFVFTDRLSYVTNYVAEACSHESGHTLGLSHQGLFDGSCNLVDPYNPGTGTGEISWAPIMGNSYGKNMTTWWNGPTQYGCTLTEDEIAIISSTSNGISVVTDDYGDTFGDAYLFRRLPHSAEAQLYGTINSSADQDMFIFCNFSGGERHIVVRPENFGSNNAGANLDIKMTLYDASFTVLAVYDPPTTMESILQHRLLRVTIII
jgi:hypothetical protein